MTGNANRKFVFVAVIGLAALAISVGMVSAAGDTEVSVEPSNETVTENDVQTFEIVVENATDDVQGFNFTVSLSDSSAADIVGASPGASVDSNQSFSADISSDNSSVTVDALLASQSQVFNSTTPTIVTVDVEGVAAGQTELDTDLATSTSPYVGIAAEAGAKYNVTASNAATIDIVQPQPNFQVSNLSAPASATAGETINVTADVTNVGTANGSQDVGFRLDGTELGNVSVSLNVSETALVDFSVDTSGTPSGTYTHGIFTADSNQTAQISITQPESDFQVSNLDAPAVVTQGDNVTVNATVTNAGTASGNDTVEFRFDGSVVSSTNVSLDPGQSQDVSVTLDTSGQTTGDYTHGFFTSDNNQTAQISIVSSPTATFQVSNLSVPSTATKGDAVPVNATITNVGNADGTAAVEVIVDGNPVTTTNVSVVASASQTYSITLNTSNLSVGNHTIEIATGGSSVSSQLTVNQAGIQLPGTAGPAQSIDSDPLLEDVDGDGSANVFDAIELYNQRNTPAVQNNPQFFDFDGDSNINVFDAIELFNKIS